MHDSIDKPVILSLMARRLRVPSKWLRAEAEAGRIPHLKAGNVLLFDPDTVDRLIAERVRSEGRKEATDASL